MDDHIAEWAISFDKPLLLIDNLSTIRAIENRETKRRSKHIEIKYHYIREEHTVGNDCHRTALTSIKTNIKRLEHTRIIFATDYSTALQPYLFRFERGLSMHYMSHDSCVKCSLDKDALACGARAPPNAQARCTSITNSYFQHTHTFTHIHT